MLLDEKTGFRLRVGPFVSPAQLTQFLTLNLHPRAERDSRKIRGTKTVLHHEFIIGHFAINSSFRDHIRSALKIFGKDFQIFPRFHRKNVCKILKSNGRNFVPLLPTIPKIESIIFFFLKRNKIENYRNNKLSRFIISPKIKFSQIYTYNPNSGWNKSKIKKN